MSFNFNVGLCNIYVYPLTMSIATILSNSNSPLTVFDLYPKYRVVCGMFRFWGVFCYPRWIRRLHVNGELLTRKVDSACPEFKPRRG